MHLLFPVLDSEGVAVSLIFSSAKGFRTGFQNANERTDFLPSFVLLVSRSNYSLSDSWDSDDECVHNSVTHILAPHSSFLPLSLICAVVFIVF